MVNDEYREYDARRYKLWIEDREGERHFVLAVGIPNVTSLPAAPDLSSLRDKLLAYPEEILNRISGEVDILLGLPTSSLHGWSVKQIGQIRVLKSKFGCGYGLRGTHLLGDSGEPVCSALSTTLRQDMQVKPPI